MKIRLGVIVGVLAAAMALSAPAAHAQVVGEDSVTGSARDCSVPEPCPADPSAPSLFVALIADARSGPAGQQPSGTMTWADRIPGEIIVGETRVTCLSVTGKVAVVGVEGTLSFRRFGFTRAVAGYIRVTDGGGPSSGLDTYEIAVPFGPFPPPVPPPPPPPGPADCSSFPGGVAVQHNEEGDLVVADAPALPTSKEQCKNGGYASFGFRTQGRCVAFVQREPHGPAPPV